MDDVRFGIWVFKDLISRILIWIRRIWKMFDLGFKSSKIQKAGFLFGFVGYGRCLIWDSSLWGFKKWDSYSNSWCMGNVRFGIWFGFVNRNAIDVDGLRTEFVFVIVSGILKERYSNSFNMDEFWFGIWELKIRKARFLFGYVGYGQCSIWD